MADINAAFMKQIFDLPERQGKPNIKHHRKANNLRRVFEITEWILHAALARAAGFSLQVIFF